jgi:hypothetical protein
MTGSRADLAAKVSAPAHRHPWVLSAFGFLLLTLASRMASLRAPIGEDTAGYLYVGRTIFDGGTPYLDAAEPKGPATHVLFGAIGLLTGDSAIAVRLVLALAATATALLLARWVARSAGMRTGLLAGALFASLGTATALDGLDPNTEQFGVLFMVAAVLLCASGSTLGAAGAGALSAWAILMNPGFATILIVAGVELLRATRGSGARTVLVRIATFAGGMLLMAAPFGIWLGAAGALDDMRVQVWDYARLAADARLTSSPPATSITDLRHLLDLPAGGLWIAGGVGAVVAIALDGRARAIGWSALLWMAVAWLRGKSNSGFEWNHHYYVAMPGIAAGLGAGVGALLDVVPRRAGVAVAAMVLAAPVWIYVVGPQWRDWALPSDQRANVARFAAAYPVAEVIRRETPPGSQIFVAGSEAEIYWLSGRRAPTRWFVNYGLFATPEYASERERDLRRNPPAAIALLAPETLNDVGDDVERLIRDLGYRIVWQTPQATVWTRGPR